MSLDEMKPGIETLRDVVSWANWQLEDHWLPASGPAPTAAQIIELFQLCQTWDIETPEHLAEHEKPEARRAWRAWLRARG